MLLPESFRLGYFEFEIEEVINLKDENGDVLFGDCDTDLKKLRIDPTHSEQLVKESLLHEALHACLTDHGVLTEDMEEKLVRILSPKLIELFTNNGELRDFIFNREEEESTDETTPDKSCSCSEQCDNDG